MNAYQRASEAIGKELTRLKGLSEAAEVLQDFGTLMQTSEEKAARLEKLHSEIEFQSARLKTAQEKASAAEAATVETIRRAEGDARDITGNAEAKAKEILHDARTKAAHVINEAQTKAESIADAGKRLQAAMAAVKVA